MVFINKQPILDTDNRLCAFLIDPVPSGSRERPENHTLFLENLLAVGLKRFSGGKTLFIRIHTELLTESIIRDFATEGTIFAIDRIDENSYRNIETIRQLGARAALFVDTRSDIPLSTFEQLARMCDYFIIDASLHHARELETLLFTFRRLNGTLMAINVHSHAVREKLRSLGFTLLGGSYFTLPVESETDVPQHDLTLLDLLNTLEQGSSIDEIAGKFAHTPDLTFQLLKFLNSPAFGFSKSIKSIRHALMMIGRKELRRWLLMLALEASETEGGGPSALNLTARERTAFITALFDHAPALPEALQGEAAFMAVLALMDALTGLSHTRIFDTISVDDTLRRAVISHEGELGQLLALCLATERHDIARVLALLKTLGSPQESYERALLQSYQGEWPAV